MEVQRDNKISTAIKYRHYFPSTKVLTAGHDVVTLMMTNSGKEDYWEEAIWMKFTGRYDKNGKEIYAGDIKRNEIERNGGDETYYFVCAWIKEWGMWGWICATNGEWHNFTVSDADALDSSSVFGYTVEGGKDDVICGNIYNNIELLNNNLL